ncbi:hypothetical protein LSUE1_G007322 [Lachnellula suecica]|uniref:Uncharacterized protein n=1 Tax=Lachnellula suecica TaxID=602035 RepID=A0A8T9CEQ0_9HELO|nr:hypothetical protein LSUE1_G007322 [Lachnellula suecica]
MQYTSRQDAVAKGCGFLAKEAGNLMSTTNTNRQIQDNFSQLLILEVTGNVNITGKPVGTTKSFPDDFDTTSLAWTTLPIGARSSEIARSVIDDILELNNDGLITTYFDKSGLRIRTDPVVCINVLHLCYHHDYVSPALHITLSHVISVLQDRKYALGTYYYQSPDHFLFFLARLVCSENALHLRATVLPLLQERLQERASVIGDALELAMRILAAVWTGIYECAECLWEKDLQRLRELQNDDGSWKIGWLCRYGASGVLVGNQGLTTALAIKALEETKLSQEM